MKCDKAHCKIWGKEICCRICEFQNECDMPCEKKDRRCKHRSDRRRKKKEPLGKYIFIGAIIILVAILTVQAITISKLNTIIMMNTDTLNSLNEISTQTERLSKESEQADIFIQNELDPPKIANFDLTEDEREYIIRVCMAEAGTDISGNMAVAQVIHDRAYLWNKTPIEVVTQESQFAKPRGGELYEESVQAVWAIFDEGMRAFEDEYVTHFHAEWLAPPYWTENKTFVANRGGNLFYR